MTLVDTSVWIEHLRRGEPGLTHLLSGGTVMCHPFVIGELAMGSLKNRREILGLLDNLPAAPVASHDEVLTLVERHRLSGLGLGWIDAHLLASARLAAARVWTRDRRLAESARTLGVEFDV